MRSVPAALAMLDRHPILIHAYMLIGSLAIACLIPLYSSYVVTELGEPAWKLAFFIACSTLITLFSNRYFGARIDAGARLKPILIFCSTLYVINMGLQSAVPTYWMLLLGIPLMGVSGGVLSTMYSFGRLFAEQTNRDTAKFNSHLRIAQALGWMIGTPVAFTLYGIFGVSSIFPTSGIISVFWLAMGLAIVPKGFTTHHLVKGNTNSPIEPVPFALILACLPAHLCTHLSKRHFCVRRTNLLHPRDGIPNGNSGTGIFGKVLCGSHCHLLCRKACAKAGAQECNAALSPAWNPLLPFNCQSNRPKPGLSALRTGRALLWHQRRNWPHLRPVLCLTQTGDRHGLLYKRPICWKSGWKHDDRHSRKHHHL